MGVRLQRRNIILLNAGIDIFINESNDTCKEGEGEIPYYRLLLTTITIAQD